MSLKKRITFTHSMIVDDGDNEDEVIDGMIECLRQDGSWPTDEDILIDRLPELEGVEHPNAKGRPGESCFGEFNEPGLFDDAVICKECGWVMPIRTIKETYITGEPHSRKDE